jgi:hypothetical protein
VTTMTSMRLTPRRILLATAALAMVTPLACSDDDGTSPAVAVAGVTVANAVDTLGIADTARLQAIARAANDAVVDAPLAWRSLDAAFATVGATGLLTGVDSGDARIVVAARGRTTVEDTILVRVRPLPHAVEFSGLGDTAYVSSTVTVRPTVMDGRGLVMPTPRLQWSSSDTSILTVDTLGRVSGRGLGSAWLRVAAGPARDSVRVPVDYGRVSTPAPFVQYAARYLVSGGSCGRTADGVVWCDNAAIASPPAFTDVQMGQNAACGLAADSTVYCWGWNDHAQFGNSTRFPTSSSVPVRGYGGRKLRRLAVGDHHQTCGIQAADSVVYCVGHNDFGQVGRLPVGNDTLLAPVTGSLKALDLDITGFHGCAIALDGSLWCWGDAGTFNLGGQAVAPTQLTPPSGYVQVAALEWRGACMRAGDGTVDCLVDGQLRRVETTARFTTITAITEASVCGLTAAGDMWCWDFPVQFTAPATVTARHVAPGRTYVALATGRRCMIDAQQRTYCF